MLVITTILLAAGLSQRMGHDKLMIEIKSKTILQHAIDLLHRLPTNKIIVTTDEKINKVHIPSDITICINPTPEEGLSKSIKIGTKKAVEKALNKEPISHILFLNADQLLLKPEDITPILNAAENNPDKIIFPEIFSKPTSPTLFPIKYHNELINLSSEKTGRYIRDKYKEQNLVITPKYHERFKDIDTPEDLSDII